jgi:hypothetical protein
MKILMATDGSKEADIALHSASRLLKTSDVHVDVLSVAAGFPAARSKAGFSQLRESYQAGFFLQLGASWNRLRRRSAQKAPGRPT